MVKKTKKNLIIGRQPIYEALNVHQPIFKIYLKRQLKGEVIQSILKMARQQNVPVQNVPSEKLNSLSRKNHQGIIAELSPIRFYAIEDVLSQVYDKGDLPLFLILDQVSDVRNFGAIVRTALCMGVQTVVIPNRGSASINEEAIKSSAGALLQLPICRSYSLAQSIEYLQSSGVQVMAADLAQKQYIHQQDLNVPLAILMGSEGRGIDKTLLKTVDIIAQIPMQHSFDSLNVSVATGMILYEVQQQRMGK